MIGLLIYLLESSLTRSLAEARRTASDLQTTNRELESLQGQLAQRVEERTAALEHSTAVANRRVEQLRAVSEVARRITAETDISQLLTEVTQLISEGFGYYHTGVFLIDETHRFVELRAANSQGGQHMLARRHRLEMDGTGIVATVAATGRPRIAEDVSQDLPSARIPTFPTRGRKCRCLSSLERE
jgi:transcriptional regulator with GAF, ATPase, and Fis domain